MLVVAVPTTPVDDDRLAPDVCQVILMLFFDAARLF
jgi:hypothetical protein